MVLLTTHQLVLINQHSNYEYIFTARASRSRTSEKLQYLMVMVDTKRNLIHHSIKLPHVFEVVLIITFHQHRNSQPPSPFFSTKLNCNNSHTQHSTIAAIVCRETCTRLYVLPGRRSNWNWKAEQIRPADLYFELRELAVR